MLVRFNVRYLRVVTCMVVQLGGEMKEGGRKEVSCVILALILRACVRKWCDIEDGYVFVA